jgi:hypothetical protein
MAIITHFEDFSSDILIVNQFLQMVSYKDECAMIRTYKRIFVMTRQTLEIPCHFSNFEANSHLVISHALLIDKVPGVLIYGEPSNSDVERLFFMAYKGEHEILLTFVDVKARIFFNRLCVRFLDGINLSSGFSN